MRVTHQEISFPQRNPHHGAYEWAGYAGDNAQAMIRLRYEELKCDIFDNYTISLSTDNGATWKENETWPRGEQTEQGTRRAMWSVGVPDPHTGRLVLTGKEGFFSRDNSLEGMTHFAPYYRVSEDAGRTWSVYEPIVQAGEAYSEEFPCRGVRIGRNSAQPANTEIFTSDGRLLVPCNVSTVGPDDNYYRPSGAYTYTAGGVLIGTWRDDGRLDWDFSELVTLAPERSLRGAIEPTLAELPDGRILMVLRANCGTSPDYGERRKWYCVSADGGATWSEPQPWTYADGSICYSPSSISRLIKHSNGDLYWIGNVSEKRPDDALDGNAPRHPLVIGRVDLDSLLLERESLCIVDTRREGDTANLQLSNFSAYEDRLSGEIVIRVTRWDGQMFGEPEPTDASVHLYRMQP